MFLDTMMGFLLHTTVSINVFSTKRQSEREKRDIKSDRDRMSVRVLMKKKSLILQSDTLRCT